MNFIKHHNKKTFSLTIICIVGLLISGCSNNDLPNTEEVMDSEFIVKFVPVIKNRYQSRVEFEETQTELTEFYVNAWSGMFSKGRDVRNYLVDGAWSSDTQINWPTNNQKISFWGLSRPFANGDEVSESKMNRSTQQFVYTLNPEEPKDLLYASRLNTFYDEADGKVQLNFIYSLAYPRLTCKQGIEDALISVKEVVFHNLKTSERLVFDSKYNSEATWEAVDEDTYGNFNMIHESAVELIPNEIVNLTGSWILMPQKVTKWNTKATAPVPITTADEKHQCYVELKCKIIKDGGIYAWGHASGENEYESIYIPFSTSFNRQAYTNTIRLNLTATGIYNADGTVFTPRAELMNAPWVTEDIIVEPWEELPEEDLEFGAKQALR